MTYGPASALMTQIPEMHSLEQLDLQNNGLSEETINTFLASAFYASKNLRFVDLSNNMIGELKQGTRDSLTSLQQNMPQLQIQGLCMGEVEPTPF